MPISFPAQLFSRWLSAPLVISFFATGLSAQTDWLRRTDGSSVAFEYLSPNFKAEASFFRISGFVLVASARVAIGEDLSLMVDLPYSQSTTEFSFFGPTQTTTERAFANPYVGVEFSSPASNSFGTVGMFLPILKSNKIGAVTATVVGDYVHYGRYIPEYVNLHTGYYYHPRPESGLTFLLGGGPSVWIPTGGGGSDTELFVDYRGGIGFMTGVLNLGVTLYGLWFVTQNDVFSSDAFRHHLQMEANARIGIFQPGLYMRIPLGSDLSDFITNTFGARVGVSI